MAGQYARTTDVAPGKSRDEIERTLTRYGARKFAYGWDHNHALIAFEAEGRQIRVTLPLPDRTQFKRTETGRQRTENAAQQAYEQDVRRAWRALALVIKAKLEAVASGIVTFEDEWMAYVVLPDGRTVAEHVQPLIDQAYDTGMVPEMLPNYSSTRQLTAGGS